MNDEGVAEVARRIQGRSLIAWMRKHKRSTPQQNLYLDSFVKKSFDSLCLSRWHLDLAL